MTTATEPLATEGGLTLTVNSSTAECAWCLDGVRAGLHIDFEGWWSNAVCVKHVMQLWPGMVPDDFRPVQYATVFKMRMSSVQGSGAVALGWETFPNFHALFAASREILRGGWFEQIYTSSNGHYRATGHHRMVFAPVRKDGERCGRVVLHVVVK